tara:strand:+ start:659 stop:1120 length:462 start_codon:yes stop_codon:yes gene_type:complete
MNFIMTSQVKNNIFNFCLKQYPKEACGLLLGNISKDNIRCTFSINSKNMAKNPYKFFDIDVRNIFKAELFSRNNNISLLGHFHSHPDSPSGDIPSKHDIKNISNLKYHWIIVSIQNKMIKSVSAFTPHNIQNSKLNDFKKINLVIENQTEKYE